MLINKTLAVANLGNLCSKINYTVSLNRFTFGILISKYRDQSVLTYVGNTILREMMHFCWVIHKPRGQLRVEGG